MPSARYVRSRNGGTCSAEFFHPNHIEPGDITRVTVHFPGDELVSFFGVQPFTRTRVCQWCVVRDAIEDARRNEYGLLEFQDRQGDTWVFGREGLMHTPETAPFEFDHVQRKWGPLRVTGENGVRND